ncbi:MAG TPA: hypothetical protein VFV34_28235 [Blastocatellia bacterium]|nr:hypothetical protein [Blastocatellia bacterium]
MKKNKNQQDKGFTNDKLADLVYALVGLGAIDQQALPPIEQRDPLVEAFQYGYWEVEGVRKKAVVRASSAAEALERAERAGLVNEWEFATARFLGTEELGAGIEE